jgi:adenine-specific DNA-methyltransferase
MTIEPVSADDPAAKTHDAIAANIEALRALFPQAFAEGKVHFDVLRELLGDHVDEAEERYGLNWNGKRRARRLALQPSLGTLRPAKDDSVGWDETKNMVIEGDNLEVLKLLTKSYAGKVKLIYIDPPYNTGNDFVYPDDYADSLGNYMRRTGQVDGEGVKNTSNPESSGRFHTDWLNMMYPRLMLAKQLICNTGLIAISIDDIEFSNLISVLMSIFGEDNHLATFVRKRRMASGLRADAFSPDHEYIVVFSKNRNAVEVFGLPKNIKDFKMRDKGGLFRSTDLTVGMGRSLRPNQYYPISNPRTGREFYPSEDRVWRFEPSTMTQQILDDNIIWPDDYPDSRMSRPRFKTRWSSEDDSLNPVSTWINFSETDESDAFRIGMNEEATREVRELVGDGVFSYPKPISLGRAITSITTRAQDIILDFFAGSGTTGHAVMAQNAADGGGRRYILVQLPELLDPADKNQKTAADFCDALGKPRTIAELTKERLRRAARKIKSENPDTKADLGFRVYKLATSNLKRWQPRTDTDEALAADLADAADNLLPGRSNDDLLVELLLKRGIDLCEPMLEKQVDGRSFQAFGGGVLVTHLGDVGPKDAETVATTIADWIIALNPPAPAIVFFRDIGFADDVAKSNTDAILRQRLKDRGPGLPDLLEAVRSV